MILICILYLGFIFSPRTLSYVAIVPNFNGIVKSLQSNEAPQICLTRLAASMCISIPSHFGSFVPNPLCASPTRFQGMGMTSLILMTIEQLQFQNQLLVNNSLKSIYCQKRSWGVWDPFYLWGPEILVTYSHLSPCAWKEPKSKSPSS